MDLQALACYKYGIILLPPGIAREVVAEDLLIRLRGQVAGGAVDPDKDARLGIKIALQAFHALYHGRIA